MAGARLRPLWVLIHRYTGLAMAGFLILEGVTGSLLAFQGPIGQWLAPTPTASHPGMTQMGLGALAAHLEAIEPRARVGYFSVDDGQVHVSLQPRVDPATGRPFVLDFDHIRLDPWTGAELSKQRHGDLSQGAKNVMPFIYDLHQNLAVGPWGTILLGIVAVLWTLDCFVAVYLTLPTTSSRFLPRWKTAWLLKWPTGVFRFNFDLHRASGLWLWPVWFVFAWSSVMFTLPDQVYGPVSSAVFHYRSDAEMMAQMNRRPPVSTPRIGWIQAQAIGERLMAKAAADHQFAIIRPYGMAYIPGWNVYTYAVEASGRVQAHGWENSLWLDGDSGALVELDLAKTRPLGAQVDVWLRALHFADLGDNLAWRWFVFAVGLVTTILSVTGVYIWWTKHAARRVSRARRRQAALAEGAP